MPQSEVNRYTGKWWFQRRFCGKELFRKKKHFTGNESGGNTINPATTNLNHTIRKMTIRQKLLKWLYPFIMKMTGKDSNKMGKRLSNKEQVEPIASFYDLKAVANNGKEISMSEFRGKKVMLVNVASNCGYTNQYEALEKLYQENKEHLVILGFPANDFKEQEAGTDQEIAQFCKVNFGVSFPLFKKQSVLKPAQGNVYEWLTDERKNGWNNQEPVWNFSKYIVDEKGVLKNFYGSAVSPLSPEILKSIE